ncbi:MAG TPA: hypothetical protein VFE49_10470 [Jiangellaceae bacterium]|nr:hypothetical protein [Jiangellaceae bacterium]
MPLPPSVRERCQELLEPGEQIRYLFPATSAVMSIGIAAAPFFVAVTDRAIVLVTGKFLRRNRPDQVWGRFPRTTRLGPLESSLGPAFELGGMIFEVDEEYAAEVAAADAELEGPAGMPDDPFPQL